VDRLHLPAELDARSLAEWASAWVHVEKAGALAIHVPGDAFYRPIALVALAACVADRVERGLLTRFETDDPGSMLWRHLRSIDFFNVLGVEVSDSPDQDAPEDRCAPLLRITDFATARQNANAQSASLERQLPSLAPSLARMARFVMEELGANIVQHSARPQTGFGLAQAFPKLGRFELAFADRGVGFATSLQRYPELAGRIHSDAEALQIALAPSVSGVGDPRRNMGFGLKLLSNFSDHLGADLWIASGDAVLHRRNSVGSGRMSKVLATPRWRGTWVCLDAPIP
jgi:anti-sigma regulatory factor (Ser/Thr protein kinase)